jgi:hypothetical protein
VKIYDLPVGHDVGDVSDDLGDVGDEDANLIAVTAHHP